MKRLILILAVLISFIALPAFGQVTWHDLNVVPIAWDEWVKIQPTDTITYFVYVKYVATGEILGTISTPNGLAAQEVSTLQATVTLPVEGRYYFGVATSRLVQGETVPKVSGINWSDTNGVWTPNPFGAVWIIKPGPPPSLRFQP